MTQNSLDQWIADVPRPKANGHKYNRGHALIVGGAEKTGAARLAARACARIGAGLTTILAPAGKGDLYRMEVEPHLMVSEESISHFIPNDKVTAWCIGPGLGLGRAAEVEAIIYSGKPAVLDADALRTGIVGHEKIVLTPHEGEFSRMFPDIEGDKKEKVWQAATTSKSVVLLKGEQTVIAAPDGRYVVNEADALYLASAGTGDVLSGMITGLLAQGMEPFQAACAAVWIHGELGRYIGAGLVASDLPDHLPVILKKLGL